mmetsp:Transcript_41586/g.81574  ORF Transcript_41586/g.81574 Transcript_41586/m.81574 type:complete len:312 (+) Transcript_41586:42-977(+)|eukprot:CAMPEP_0175121918 /NCGR_PEP_ID=MMETSP0087-20121206/1433_1 /TAXON_ID=136419 /ORGANISM="Unknown Unknown, Strain D1" /LENGTH=311 /DNA_ID=CAMNT_0016403509 /DNA_START=42 /DNA_END=977 /DNA_ORIENTATION=+
MSWYTYKEGDEAILKKETQEWDVISPTLFVTYTTFICPFLVWHAGWQPQYLWISFLMWYVHMVGTLAGYHRYFSHRSYKAGRKMTFFIACLGILGGQGGPLFWSCQHRYHHRQCETVHDTHSPKRFVKKYGPVLGGMLGFLWAQGAYLTKGVPQHPAMVKDWLKFPEIVSLEKFSAVVYYSQYALLYMFGGFPLAVYGVALPTIMSFNSVQLVNSAAHLWGKEIYTSSDTADCHAGNMWWLTPIMLGANWHNNHHAQPNTARAGFEWWQIDPMYYTILVWYYLGLVTDLKQPDRKKLERIGEPDSNSKKAS